MVTSGYRYLRVADLRRLRRLGFQCRVPVEGVYSGLHRSRQRGQSAEFSDYRPYMPGDEPGDIDWKIYGRTDRLYVKLFEHQSDLTVHLLVDASASMAYRGLASQARVRWDKADPAAEGDSKYDYACRMAAALAFLTCLRRDRVALTIAREGGCDSILPQTSMRGLHGLLARLEEASPAGEAKLAQAIGWVARGMKRRCVLVVFSDLLDDVREILAALSGFRHKGGEVVLFHLLHRDELDLAGLNEAMMVDSETLNRFPVHADEVRKRYTQTINHYLSATAAEARARGFDYNRTWTSIDYYKSLERYLLSRKARR